MKRHEWWRKHYREYRDLDHLTPDQIGNRWIDCANNQAVWAKRGKLGLTNPGEGGEIWMQLQTEVLEECHLAPMCISQNRIARDIGVPPRRINEIVHGKRAVTADTALRLSRYFSTSEGFWMGLQADYDLEEARNRLGKRLQQEVRTHAALFLR